MTSTFVQLALVAFVLLAAGRASCEPAINQRGVAQSSNELSQFVSNSEALAALDGFDAGRGLALNTKRAKGKMSAFMPMRGRRAFDGGVAEYGRDGDSPADFLRSAVAMALQQQQQPRQQPTINAMPRQFVEQLEAHRMRAPALMIRSNRPFIDQFNIQDTPSGGGGDLMEAKFRRAFHPMRGKRDNNNNLDDMSYPELDAMDVLVA